MINNRNKRRKAVKQAYKSESTNHKKGTNSQESKSKQVSLSINKINGHKALSSAADGPGASDTSYGRSC